MSETILVVDDNKVNLKLLSAILRREGYRVLEAQDGRKALETARKHKPDLVLLDVVMPHLDGYRVCRKLKEDPETENIPVIFLSARAEAEDKIKGLEIGAADYVTKPFDKGEVLARVRSQLRIRNLTKKLMKANRQLNDKQRKLDLDLRAAAGIQRSLLPQQFLKTPALESAWKFMPCESIGGDIFNIARIDEHHFAFYILDVSGHGVPSALITVSVSQMLQPHTGNIVKRGINDHPYYAISSPSEVLSTLDQLMAPGEVLSRLDREYPIERFDKFFTIVYLLLDVRTGKVRYSNGGHPPPFLIHPDGSYEKLDVGGPLIGLGGILPFENGELTLKARDRVILYTDGVLEQRNGQGDFFGEKRCLDVLVAHRASPLDRQLDALMETVLAFGPDGKPQDDISLLGIQYNGSR